MKCDVTRCMNLATSRVLDLAKAARDKKKADMSKRQPSSKETPRGGLQGQKPCRSLCLFNTVYVCLSPHDVCTHPGHMCPYRAHLQWISAAITLLKSPSAKRRVAGSPRTITSPFLGMKNATGYHFYCQPPPSPPLPISLCPFLLHTKSRFCRVKACKWACLLESPNLVTSRTPGPSFVRDASAQ